MAWFICTRSEANSRASRGVLVRLSALNPDRRGWLPLADATRHSMAEYWTLGLYTGAVFASLSEVGFEPAGVVSAFTKSS